MSDDGLPKRVSTTVEELETFDSRDAFSSVAYALYKESAALLLICAAIRLPDKPHLRRNHAILAGLLIRIHKFMLSIAVLTAEMPRSREVVFALNRCIAETLINALYLMQEGENEQLFDDFVTKSLGPEKEMLEEINFNVATNGGTPTVMESRMLASIARTFDQSGVDPTTVPIKHQEWATNMRERLKALGWPRGYAFLYRQNSHAIHGTWVDLLLNNLEIHRSR